MARPVRPLLAVPARRRLSLTALPCGPRPAVAADQVNVRAGPSLDTVILAVLADGASLILLGGPGSADGCDWDQTYDQRYTAGTPPSGWVAGAYLSLQ